VPLTRRIAITLFEDQLVRTYFAGAQNCLIREISGNEGAFIFTSKELRDLVKKNVTELNMTNVEVCVFNKTTGGLLYRFLSFLLRWSLQSGSVYVSIRRSSKTKYIPRKIVNSFFYYFPAGKELTRAFFRLSLSLRTLQNAFEISTNQLNEIESIFVTSLTNLYEDVSVAIYFSRKGKKVVGTVRSWDNLTSHGALHFVPEEFLEHSAWIRHAALEFQGLNENLCRSWDSPSHQVRFLQSSACPKTISQTRTIKVLYASMGLETNPDDLNMINWLCKAWETTPKEFELTILQHPKFSIEPEFLTEGVSIVKLSYSDSNLSDYYSFLQSHDLVFGGGTTVILDASFAQIPVALTKFEIIQQNYWDSHLRYFDYLDHSKLLFELGKYSVVESQTELINFILARKYRKADAASNYFFSTCADLIA